MYNWRLASLYRAFVFSIYGFAVYNKLYVFIFYRLLMFACNVAMMHAWDNYI